MLLFINENTTIFNSWPHTLLWCLLYFLFLKINASFVWKVSCCGGVSQVYQTW
jgi:hypothetical protein